MKYFVILLTILVYGKRSVGQSADDSVRTVINRMFTGMKNADTSLLNSCFAGTAIFQTIVKGKDGNLIVRSENVTDFISYMGKQKPGAADEQIIFETVKTDGPLAIAWTPYKFYFDGKFSHCGVNSFQLVRFGKEWKIQYLIDTRRKDNCN